MISIGIDPSTVATGIVVLKGSGTKTPDLVLETEIKPKDLKGMTRTHWIVTKIMELIHDHKPDTIVVEGYSLNMKNASSVVPLVELGGVLRLCLHVDEFSWLDPRATELKKFVTGKGSGAKDQIQMMVLHNWGHLSKSNNTADAYGLACIGLAYRGALPGITKEARAVVGALPLRRE